MERLALWLQTKAEASSALQPSAKAAGSHLGCEAVQACIPVAFPGRNTSCAGSPSAKAARNPLGVSLVGWRFPTQPNVVLLEQGCPSQRQI